MTPDRALEPISPGWGIPRAGEVIGGKYVVEATCGRGGIAVVLTALHADLDRRVAIKVLLPEWAGDAEIVERFLREGRTATRITSEHVARVFDIGVVDGGPPYLVLEHLEGHNLQEVLSTWGPLPVPTAIDWILQAAEAVGEAHAHGVVHRDLKPANLFLTHRADGSACIKVIDFGLSRVIEPRPRSAAERITLETEVFGSPHYTAPEQLRAACLADHRSDIWSLGAILHELIAGQPPFQGESAPGVCAAVLASEAPPISALRPKVPAAVEHAVLRCLQKDPDARFPSVAEMARAVASWGTSRSLASCERIDRIVRDPVRPSDPMPAATPPDADRAVAAPPPPPDPEQAADVDRRVFQAPASARVVLGALLIMAGLASAVFMALYESVHGSDPPTARSTSATSKAAPEPEPAREPAVVPAPALAPAPSLAPATVRRRPAKVRQVPSPPRPTRRLGPLSSPRPASPASAPASPPTPPSQPEGSARAAPNTDLFNERE